MSVEYTDPSKVSRVKIEAAPRSGQTVSGYGGKTPTRYMVRYVNRWHRVYMMQFGNSGTPYIIVGGEDLVLDIDTAHTLEEIR